MSTSIKVLLSFAVGLMSLTAAPVVWTDWVSGTTGANGTAQGVLNLGATNVNVDVSGEITFLQTNGGTNFWSPTDPFTSSLVDNAPPASDVVGLTTAGQRTVNFSQPVDNLFLAFMSINLNTYEFANDFDIVSTGGGYWGNGTVVKETAGGVHRLKTTSVEPHGVLRFNGAVSSISWNVAADEYWHGFTVGTYAVPADPGIDSPEPSTWGMMLAGFAAVTLRVRRQRRN